MIKSIQEEEQREEGRKKESSCCLHEETNGSVHWRASTSSSFSQSYGIFHKGLN